MGVRFSRTKKRSNRTSRRRAYSTSSEEESDSRPRSPISSSGRGSGDPIVRGDVRGRDIYVGTNISKDVQNEAPGASLKHLATCMDNLTGVMSDMVNNRSNVVDTAGVSVPVPNPVLAATSGNSTAPPSGVVAPPGTVPVTPSTAGPSLVLNPPSLPPTGTPAPAVTTGLGGNSQATARAGCTKKASGRKAKPATG